MSGGPAGPAGRATDSGNFFPTGTGWFSIPSVDRSTGDRGLTPEATRRWLDDARRLNRHIPRVDRALIHAEESRRLNVRALGTPESSRSLRGGLEALEVCSVAVRTVFRALDDWVREGLGGAATADVVATRTACAELMVDLAAVVRAFGAVLRAEVESAATAEQADLTNALDRLRSERDRYAEVLYADPREHPDLWELTGSLLVLIDRMLLEFDTAAHARLWEDRRRAALDRGRAADLVHRLRPPRRTGERPHDDAHGSGGRAGPADAPGTAPEQRSHPPTRGPRRRKDTR
jgi:hypothetical protein